MKRMKRIIAGLTIIGALLAFSSAVSAAWAYRRSELGRDHRELAAARRELRHDLRRGAGPGEIAHDPAVIARERREIWQDRHDWRHRHGRHYDGRRYGYSDYRRG